MTPTQTNAYKFTIFWGEILQIEPIYIWSWLIAPQMGNLMIPQYPDLSSRFA